MSVGLRRARAGAGCGAAVGRRRWQRGWSLGLDESGHRNRILGSRRAANRSVARLRNTTAVPSTSVMAWTTGKSRLSIELSNSDPSPLRLKTCSTMTVEPIR